MRIRSAGRVLLPVVFLSLLLPTASAHANLVGGEPSPYAKLSSPPGEIVLHFSEALEDRYTSVSVEDASGRERVRSFAIEENRLHLRAQLDPLADGVATVRWRTLSVDTHTTNGVYLLAVNATFARIPHQHGNATNATHHHDGGHSHGSAAEGWARGAAFLGTTVAPGIALFLLLQGPRVEPSRRRLAAVGAGAALLGIAGTFAVLAAIGARIELGTLEAAQTAVGGRMVARAALLAAAALLLGLAVRRPDRAVLVGAAVAGAGALLLTSLTSHAAASPDRWALAADILHLAGVAAWVGGVVALAVVLARGGEAAALRSTVERFSPLAVGSVAVIVLTGLYGTLLHIRAPSDLVFTPYGQALLLKILLMAPILGLGAANRYLLTPRLDRPGGRARLHGVVLFEVLLMGMAMAAAGALANEAPPGEEPGGPALPGGEPTALPGLVHAANASGYLLEVGLLPQPPTAGFQNLTVRVTPDSGRLPANPAVFVNLHGPGGGEQLVELRRAGPDTWSAEGPLLPEAGRWTIDAVLQGLDTHAKVSFPIDVHAVGHHH